MNHEHRHSGVHHDDPDFDWLALADHLELDAEVLFELLHESVDALAAATARQGLQAERVLDIGPGPGVSTTALAHAFPEASVIAVDQSAPMLDRVSARAARFGVAVRVRTTLAELPAGMSGIGPAQAAYASMVLHHVGDERAALRAIGAELVPGGVLAVVEFGDPLRFLARQGPASTLPERLGHAGSAWLAGLRDGLVGTVPSADLPLMIADAGLELLDDRLVRTDLPVPLDERARRMLHGHLHRVREQVGADLDPADQRGLDALLDQASPEGILRRPDAALEASRRLCLARVPARGLRS